MGAGLGAAEEIEVFLKTGRATGSGMKNAHRNRVRADSRSPVAVEVVGPTVVMAPGTRSYK